MYCQYSKCKQWVDRIVWFILHLMYIITWVEDIYTPASIHIFCLLTNKIMTPLTAVVRAFLNSSIKSKFTLVYKWIVYNYYLLRVPQISRKLLRTLALDFTVVSFLMSCIWQASVLHCQPHYVVFIGTCINQNLKVNRTLSSSVFHKGWSILDKLKGCKLCVIQKNLKMIFILMWEVDELKTLLVLDVHKAEVSYLYNWF